MLLGGCQYAPFGAFGFCLVFSMLFGGCQCAPFDVFACLVFGSLDENFGLVSGSSDGSQRAKAHLQFKISSRILKVLALRRGSRSLQDRSQEVPKRGSHACISPHILLEHQKL